MPSLKRVVTIWGLPKKTGGKKKKAFHVMSSIGRVTSRRLYQSNELLRTSETGVL